MRDGKEMPRVSVLGFLSPDDDFQCLVAVDQGMPVQTQRFGRSLVQALQAGGAIVSLISALPATSYPHNPTVRFSTRRIEIDGTRGVLLGFLNVPILKHLTRTAAVFRCGPRELATSESDVLLIHGVHSPWLAFGAYASRRLGVTTVAVMTDPPNVPHQFDTTLTRALKKLDQRLVMYLLSKLDGVVALTRHLAEDFAPGVPFLVMEGIAPDPPPESQPGRPRRGPPVVLYAGGLSEEYGIRLLLDAHALNPTDYILELAGRGPIEPLLLERSAKEPNLLFLGMVSPDELPELYAAADVLVNPRPPDQGFTKYSFPSKILEYMASGRPVLSTRLEGIPAAYDDHLLWSQASPQGFRSAITSILGTPVAQREAFGRRGRAFVITGRSSRAQGRRLVEFLNRCVAGRHDDGSPAAPHRVSG